MTGRWSAAARELRLIEDALEQAGACLHRAGAATWVARAGDSYRADLADQRRRLASLLVDLEHARRAVLQHAAAADAAEAAVRVSP
jgi:hypothetical protein